MKKLFVGLATLFISVLGVSQPLTAATRPGAVLAYASSMSVSELLAQSNYMRSANGEGGLRLNSQLDSAAQAKANDMVAENYWSHYSPSGASPWTFIINAGYSYSAAGENLAYGFDNADAVISAWMNSPEHRANLLNAGYLDVGFGVANSANYVGSGPETIVVAEYGTPLYRPAPAPTYTAPAPTPPAAPKPTASAAPTTPAPVASPPTVPGPTSTVAGAAPTPTATPTKPAVQATPAANVTTHKRTPASKKPTWLAQLSNGSFKRAAFVNGTTTLASNSSAWNNFTVTVIMLATIMVLMGRTPFHLRSR